MSLSLGSTTIGSLYLGSTKVGEAYLGSTKVVTGAAELAQIPTSWGGTMA